MFRKKSLILKKVHIIVLFSMISIALLNSAGNKTEADELSKLTSSAESFSISDNISIKQSDIFDLQINKADIEKLAKINMPKYFKNAETDKSYVYLVKTFSLPEQFNNKKTVLALNGTRGELQIFLNKKLIFKKKCYDADYRINISKEIKSGKSANELLLVFNTLNFEKATFGLKSINITVLPDVHHAMNDASSGCSGIFIYAEDINLMTGSANIKIKAVIINDAAGDRTINYSGILVNLQNNTKTEIISSEISLKPEEVYNLNAEKKIGSVDLWFPDKPDLYKYYSVIKLGDEVIDIEETVAGFKKLEYIFNKEENKAGLYLNKEFIFLSGFNYSYINDWKFSDNIPRWMTDHTMKLIKGTNANIIRLTDEITAESVINTCDNNGIFIICPVKNEDELKDLISKYKNSPSLVFFEIDKKNLSAEKINKIRNILDSASPGFKRFLGAENPDFAVSGSLDWIGTKSGRYYKEDAEKTKPVMELNNLDFNSDRNSADGLSSLNINQNKIFLDNSSYGKLLINEFNRFFSKNINSSISSIRIWSGLILNTFSDYMINDREINYCGTVDFMKIKKELYNIYRIMQGGILKKHDISIMNHWNYNEGENIDVLIASNCDIVKLYINDKQVKTNRTPINKYLFKFENIKWQKGIIKAVGYKNFRKVCFAEKRSFEKQDKIKLSFESSPDGFNADSQDFIILNVEILDANNELCLSNNDTIELTIEGQGRIITDNMKDINLIKDNRYGLKINSGISRIIIQSTADPGIITINAAGAELKADELNIESKK